MKAICVTQIVRWVRMADELGEGGMTLFKLFVTAYYWRHKKLEQNVVLIDLKEFADHKTVPYYVDMYIRTVVYPLLVVVNDHPRLTLIV